MMSDNNILSVKDFAAGYRKKTIISDVSFDLKEGEILCIVGESGCGKSTLLKAVMGCYSGLKSKNGSVVFKGKDMLAMSEKDRYDFTSEHMGMVFQNPGASFNPIRTYRKQFTETLKSHKLYDSATFEETCADALSRLGLSDAKRILDSCPYEMSGGMNQRICLALTLIMKQDLLLCDEPTSALDATIQLQVANELKLLRDISGISMIVVTHNIALAKYLGDRIGVMYAGRMIEYGNADDVIDSPVHPYTKCLMAAIPRLNGDLPEGLEGVPPQDGIGMGGCAFRDRCPCAKDCEDYQYVPLEVATGHFAACKRLEDLRKEKEDMA